MNDLNRREFALATMACACAMSLPQVVEAAEPSTQPAAAPGPVDAGALTTYASNRINDAFAKPNKFFVIRADDRLYAPNAVCTHKRCTLKLRDGSMACPCHGSKYSIEGTPLKGPAKYSLYRYGISIDEKKRVIVDTSKQFDEKDWEKAGSFVSLKA